MKNKGKRNCILTGLLVFALITGMFVGNGITAAAAGGTTHHFCGVYTDASHNHKLEEGTILYPGDVVCVGGGGICDSWEVYADGTRVVSTTRGGETNWSVDATYIVTESRVDRGAYDELMGGYFYHHYLYLETYTAPEAAPVVVKEPAWVADFKDDYARMLKDIGEAESGASVEIDATVWHSFSAKQLEELMQRKDVDLVFTYAYEGDMFKVTIPAGTEMTYDCEWYGPLKVASMFGREDLETEIQ
ncbi:MAG: hypothetical protein IKL78_00970 [Lachnospiraceae bacterium]|nr:hypothetical protein [Lachnospiraceae bacterium]